MKKHIGISETFPILNAAMVVISFVIIGYFWISGEYARFRKEAASLRSEFVESQKTLIRNEVERAVDFVRYAKSSAEERLKTKLKSRTAEAYQIASNIRKGNAGIRSDADIRKMIEDALSPIRFDNGKGYFFVADETGKEILFANGPKTETGQDFWDVIEIAKMRLVGEGFYQYVWTKPGERGRNFAKIAHIRYFEPYRWLIGTAGYADDAESDIRNEVIERLVRIRFGNDGYIFASTYAGDPLFTNGKITIGGENIWEATDPNGIKVTQVQRKAVENPGGGFVSYSWIKLRDTKPSPKISFVKGFPEWGWMIGAGVYSDDIEEVIVRKGAELRNTVISHILKIILLLGILLIAIFAVAKPIHAKIRESFDRFLRFFEQAAIRSEKINPDELFFTEFRIMADSANRMLEDRIAMEKSLRETDALLRQAQKMEAIGTLAGGIAHDFNNILFPIMGYAEMLLQDLPQGSIARKNTQQILIAAERAKSLVRQILTFGRRGEPERKLLTPEPLIREVSKLLRASLPSTIEIRQQIETDCGYVLADPAQIHQILMNLCTNAYHAMREKGGILTIGAEQVRIAADQPAPCADMKPGEYLRLWVGDTGHGMMPEVMERVFEPFFTTKKIGEGTGMGLAVVLGIIKSHDGYVRAESEPGKQTTFHVYLPICADEESEPAPQEPSGILPHGTEHILVADDEAVIVCLLEEMLGTLGYRVTGMTGSTEALEAFRESPESFDLVISDVTMPVMTGLELSARLREIRPDIPIILCSGFSESVTEQKLEAANIREYLAKPIIRSELAASVRRALK